MISKIFAFLVWAACAAGLTFWGLRWWSKPLPVPSSSSTVSMMPMPQGNIARLLSIPEESANNTQTTQTEQSQLAARIQLKGLLAAVGVNGRSVALLSIDDKPAKAFRVDQKVDGDYKVLAITHKGVDIGLPDSSDPINLTAEGLPPAATGTLPAQSAKPLANMRRTPMRSNVNMQNDDSPMEDQTDDSSNEASEINPQELVNRLRQQGS